MTAQTIPQIDQNTQILIDYIIQKRSYAEMDSMQKSTLELSKKSGDDSIHLYPLFYHHQSLVTEAVS